MGWSRSRRSEHSLISWALYIFRPLHSSIFTLSTLSPPWFLHVLRSTPRDDTSSHIPCVFFSWCNGRYIYYHHLKMDLFEIHTSHINYPVMHIPSSKRFLCSCQYPHPHTPEAPQK
jgi:hypothetical protein